MKIRELYDTKKTVISLEVFPPKLTMPVETIYKTLDDLQGLKPDFISVTYGAGGNAKDRTVEIAAKLKNDYGIESLAHLTCISSTQNEIQTIFKEMKKNNIENILALRGDEPEDPTLRLPDPLPYPHASDLAAAIKAEGGFCIGGACYPEGHVECESYIQDVKNLKRKVENGAEFLISQLFFDNEQFFRFMEDLDLAGIDVPVSAGIMPVLNKNQILRMTKLSGCALPPKFCRIIERYGDDPESLKEAGIAYAIEQIIDLMTWGVKGIHLYTMNNPYIANRIYESVFRLMAS